MADARLSPVDGDPFAGTVPSPADVDAFLAERHRDAAVKYALTQSWPAQVVRGLADAATLPGDVLAGKQVVDPADPQFMNRVGNFAMNAVRAGRGAVMDSEGASLEADAAKPASITAYHGTPHDFDRFEMAHVGEGEGAQAYGHGLYFAEHPDVADNYRMTLGNMDAPQGSLLRDNAMRLLDMHGWDPDAVLSTLYGSPEKAPADVPVVKALKSYRPGNVYQVGLNVDPAKLLDWDKPMGGQAQAVQDFHAATPDLPRSQLGNSRTGAQLYNDLAVKLGSTEAASEALAKAGVPGIRFLDDGSRSASNVNELRGTASMWQKALSKTPNDPYAQQMAAQSQAELAAAEKSLTSNFVIFHDKDVDVTHKNGVPVTPVDHDPFEEGK